MKKRKHQKSSEEEITWLGRQSSGKKQKLYAILTDTHKFLPSLTMPDAEIADDICLLDSDADIQLSSSSSFSSFASSSSSSSSYSASGVEVGVSTDDPSAKMEKDPRKMARRFDFSIIFFSFSYTFLSQFAFSSLCLLT